MDLADDCLAQLDFVIASVHSGFSQDPSQATDRLLRAVANPWVDVLGHPTGRRLLKREGHKADMTRVIAAAVEAGVVMEINCQVERLDLDDVLARRARNAGARIVISTDAHSTAAFPRLRWGITVARRAGLTAADVLNTQPIETVRASFRRNRR